MDLVKRVYDASKDYVDYKMGGLGAGVMGGLVGAINYSEGVFYAATASLKQGAYTFFLGGATMKACENIATKVKNTALALSMAVIIPSSASSLATYGVHSLKGTQKPFESTIPTMVIGPIGCGYWAVKKRKEKE